MLSLHRLRWCHRLCRLSRCCIGVLLDRDNLPSMRHDDSSSCRVFCLLVSRRVLLCEEGIRCTSATARLILIPRLLWDGGVYGADHILTRMTPQHEPLPWRAIVRGVIISSGLTFLAAMLLAALGITPKIDPGLYPLLALLVGAISVAVALRMTDTTRPACLIAMGVGIWLLSGTAVLLGVQSLAGWLESSLSIAATMLLGRLLLGVLHETPVQSSYAPIVRSMSRTNRHV